MKYKFAILDDHPLMAHSLEMVLSTHDFVQLVDIYTSLKQFIAADMHYDAFIIDISLQDGDGREALKAIRKSKNKNAKIIVISSHSNPKIIQSALKNGADTYLLKTASPSEFAAAVIDLLIHNTDYLSPTIQKILTDYLKGKKMDHHQFPSLTSRELEILQLISEEYTSKEIAEKLFLSEFTIEGHRSNLFMKFNVKNTAGLITKAFYYGFMH